MTEMKDPRTGVSAFALMAYNRLNEKLASLPDVKAHSATLQMNSLNDTALAARVKFGQEKIDEHLPGIVDAMLREAGISIAADAKAQAAARDASRKDARVEPAAGSPTSPRNMSDKQLYDLAKVNVDKRFEGKYLDPAKRMEENLKERDRLLAQR